MAKTTVKYNVWDNHLKVMHYDAHLKDDFVTMLSNPKRYIALQHTGMKDKNKKNIVQGDIIKSGNGLLWEVKHGQFKYVLNHFPCVGWYLHTELCDYPLYVPQQKTMDEIVGNIYQNPEKINAD